MTTRTWFKGTVQMQTALHVGTGSILDPATDAPILRGADGRPIIPGSSLKGALRAASERLLRALGRRACLLFEEDPYREETQRCLSTSPGQKDLWQRLRSGDGTAEEMAAAREQAHALWGLSSAELERFARDERLQRRVLIDEQALCDACRTWGSIYWAGRVRVPDLRLRAEHDLGLREIRDGVGLDRDRGTARPKIKFDLEVLPAGACFELEVAVEPEADPAVVALAIGELLQGNVPLGGRVTRGLGQARLTDLVIGEVDLGDPAQLVAYLTRGARREHSGDQAAIRLQSMLALIVAEVPRAA